MLISKKCFYALRAVLEIMADIEPEPVNSALIARRQGVSSRFIEIILNELKHSGIVESRRGSSGGYLLAKNSNDITVLDIVTCIDGPIKVVSETGKDKDYFGYNVLKKHLTEVQDSIVSCFENKTLDDLYQEEKVLRNNKIINYVI